MKIKCSMCGGTGHVWLGNNVGERLSNLRAVKSLTRDELSRLTGIARGTLYNMESGRSEPTARNLLKLSRFYRVPIDSLI
ncbi:hypothetical protein LCGC14_1336930 [marine sediment metagenome]|uniref:HTH cro/C1-type domain-containing protein n=1 Tax=marine sediment metagenome TaxID=412755 RepID=A0A0F9MVP8_9ZZZZ